MESITYKEYESLIKGTDVIEKDGFGLKVLATKNGEMIKLFRRKRILSTALFKPYAVRFVDNATHLATLNIPTINVKKLVWCGPIKRHIVIYERLEGELLRNALDQAPDSAGNIIQSFGQFVAHLHNKGVYFRSAHLKNILLLPSNEFGLIDISDMQIKRRGLGLNLRQRNFEHILRYQEDKDLMRPHIDTFIQNYSNTSAFNASQTVTVRQSILSIVN